MASALGILALLFAIAAVLVPALYSYAASALPSRLPSLQNKRICLLIAHPDDEAMFFAPTVLALTRQATGNHVKILCLSTGDADGLGETRRKELIKSGMALGLRDEDDVFVIDRPDDFPDSMTTKWDEKKIANLLCSAFAPKLLAESNGNGNGNAAANIDVLVTFDSAGVSSHPNHISLYHGARAFVTRLLKHGGGGNNGRQSRVDLYTLASVNILRKYASISDVFVTVGALLLGSRGGGGAGEDEQEATHHPRALVFMSALVGDGASLGTAWGAMTQAHRSQMVWFRYLWLGLSRYMVINDLKLEEIKGT